MAQRPFSYCWEIFCTWNNLKSGLLKIHYFLSQSCIFCFNLALFFALEETFPGMLSFFCKVRNIWLQRWCASLLRKTPYRGCDSEIEAHVERGVFMNSVDSPESSFDRKSSFVTGHLYFKRYKETFLTKWNFIKKNWFHENQTFCKGCLTKTSFKFCSSTDLSSCSTWPRMKKTLL